MENGAQERIERAEAMSLVRDFSQDIAMRQPTEIIAQAFQERELINQQKEENGSQPHQRLWRKSYEDENSSNSPSEAKLSIENELLSQVWSKFLIDSEDKQSALYTKHNPLAKSKGDSMNELRTTVLAAKEKYKTIGRLPSYLDSFCSTLDAHSNLFAMLPSQSQYCSVFCGVVTTLIKASSNHRKIIEDLAKDLTEIGDVVQSCVQPAQLFNTQEMRDLVRRLYTSVFIFLREAMRWYEEKRAKRLLHSFNQDFYGKFSATLVEIRRIKELIYAKAQNASHAEIRDIRMSAERSNAEIQNSRDSIAKLLEAVSAERTDFRRKHERLDELYWLGKAQKPEERYLMLGDVNERFQIGNAMANVLIIHAEESAPMVLMFKATREGVSAKDMQWPLQRDSMYIENDIGPRPLLADPTAATRQTFAKSQLQESSRDLEDHISTSIDTISLLSSRTIFADYAIVHALQNWSAATTSQMLWIMGASERLYPSASSFLAASIVNSSDDLNIPLLQLFCDWPGKAEEKALINMIYSLIRQLIEILPSSIESPANLSPARFQALDGSVKTWDKALSIVLELLNEAPPLLLVVIDGIEHLDYLDIGEQYTKSLLQLLQSHLRRVKDEGENKKTFKVLFTTAGNCAGLNGLDDGLLEIVKVTERSAKHRPGKSEPGMAEVLGLDGRTYGEEGSSGEV